METQSNKAPNVVICSACSYENGYWRSQCEKCGAPLGKSTTGHIDSAPSSRGSTWRWIAGIIGILRLISLLARCSADSSSSYRYPTAYEPSYQPSYSASAFASPLNAVEEMMPDLLLGTDTFQNEILSVDHPLLWTVTMPELSSVEMTGQRAFLHIEWTQMPEVEDIWQMKQENPQELAAYESVVEEEFRQQLSTTDSTLLHFSRRLPRQLDDVQILFGAYEVQMMVDFELVTLIHFEARCGMQRDCTFQYLHMGRQPVNTDEWEMLAKVANSLHFVEDRVIPFDFNQSQPLSPIAPTPLEETSRHL